MNLEVQIHEANTHVSIKAAGIHNCEDLYRLFDRAKEESAKRAGRGVILDLTEIAGTVSTSDMHELASYFCCVWNRAVRIAVVSSAGGLGKFFESILWTKGVEVAVVPRRSDALEFVNQNQSERLAPDFGL